MDRTLKKRVVIESLDPFCPAIVSVGNEAFGAYVRARMWQWEHESFVTEAIAPMIASPIIWELLIASGLVERRFDGSLDVKTNAGVGVGIVDTIGRVG